MPLNTHYRYIGLDFETTGLDVTKDEPIQIGIIEIDAQGNIIDSYQSLIKPDKKTDELKHIVGFVTGLSITDLEHAPNRDTILQDIQRFFGENTIIIGHNIKFDIDFLQKYFPTLSYHQQIDTMQLAQTILHYTPSYALEILIENLKSDKNFNSIFSSNDHGEEKSHDAFFDTKNSLKLFVYFVQYVQELITSYPNLLAIIQQTTGVFAEIRDVSKETIPTKIAIQFPTLERITPTYTSMPASPVHLNTNNLENRKKYYIGNIPIKDLLTHLATNKNIILAFQNIQKLDIAKAVLNDLGIKNIGYTKEDQTINPQAFQNFLNKGVFAQDECFFVIKYLSHLKKGLGVLNLNTPSDYKIYYYIKDTRNQTKYPIILTTHHGLFTCMQDEQNTYKDYDICFFDTEQRYKSYNFFLSSPIDMYYMLNILESFVYQHELNNQIAGKTANEEELSAFVNMFQIFIGVLFNESKMLFVKTENTMIQHDPIQDHGDFYQTNLLWTQLCQKKETLKTILNEENYAILDKHITHIQKIFDNVVTVFKKMYGNSDFYFTYSEAQKFTDWKEFVDVFTNKVMFFSNTNIQLTKLIPDYQPTATTQQKISVVPPVIDTLVNTLTNKCQESDQPISYFIFSPKKEESKKIFEDLCKNNIHEKVTLLVENITGGIGKNIFKAKQSQNKIIIGGYNFILFLYANQVPLKEIILFNARGPSEQSIIDDIKWYNINPS